MPNINQVIDTFKELDITIGNGLIGDSQKMEPSSPALFIGLGGTGNHALRRLKRIIHQRYNNVSQYFAFVGIDTDSRTPENNKDYMLLDEHEKIMMKADPDFFDTKRRHLIPEYILEWLNDNATHQIRGTGAGGERAIGRALFFHTAGEIHNKLSNIIHTISAGNETANIDIFILSGISGGTGSGTTLDTAYLLKHILTGKKHTLHGFFFMPDINTSVPIPVATKNYIPPNGFAALREIDYWMSIKERGDNFKQRYTPSIEVNTSERPFDYCWPLCAINANGVVVVDALNQASTVAAETICAWVSFMPTDAAGGGSFIQSFTDNQKLMTDGFVANRANAYPSTSHPVSFWYTVCGASVAKLPVSAINTYLACILFKRFEQLYKNAFSDRIATDLVEFCEKDTVALEYSLLKRTLERSFMSRGVSLPNMTNRTYADLFQQNAEQLYTHFTSKVASESEGVKNQIIEQKLESLETEFYDMFTDQKRGPYYLDAFIQNRNRGLIPMLESFKRAALNDRGARENRDGVLLADKDEAYRNGQRVIMKDRAKNVYVTALNAYYLNQRDIMLCDACIAIYNELIERLDKKVSAAYKATFGVLQALTGTFNSNIETFSRVEVEQQAGSTQYSWDIFTMPEVVNIVTKTLKDKGINEAKQNELVEELLKDLFRLISDDMSQYENLANLEDMSFSNKLDINKFLANFVAEHFDALTKKTLKEYMEQIAQDEGLTLQQYLQREFQRMERESSPLFDRPIYADGTLYYGTIPKNDQDIAAAWRTFAGPANHKEAYPSFSNDTLVFMTIGCAVPLYAARQLPESEAAFERMMKEPTTRAARTLVSATKRSRELGHEDETWDWQFLPSIIPADARSEGDRLSDDRAWEAKCRVAVDRLFQKKLLVYNAVDSTNSYRWVNGAAFKNINSKIEPESGIAASVPIKVLREYKQKLTDLTAFLDGTQEVPPNINEIFGIHFRILSNVFTAKENDEWAMPRHEIYTFYSRALNIRRDLKITEAIYDQAKEKIAEVDHLLGKIDRVGTDAQRITRGFVCGVLTIKGSRIELVDGYEPEVLARDMQDKYPIYAAYQKLTAKRDFERINTLIEDNFAQAIDADKLDAAVIKQFRDQFKNEYKKIENETGIDESRQFFMDSIDEYIESSSILRG